jgi:uncharacterized integral membrane protein (TIGR00698 family)
MASRFVAEHYGGPTLLYALLIGMAFNFLAGEPRTAPGVACGGRNVLRLGVGLLGVQIGLADILALGPMPVVTVVLAVAATIAFGVLAARILRLDAVQGLLTGGAVAICGASAALAIAAVLPRHDDAERQTLFTVVAVTTLSTVAMILYPVLVKALALDATTAGIFLGGTIHDVAQVVGAGYLISDETGEVATFTKLLRVALLAPVVLVLGRLATSWDKGHGDRPVKTPGLPWFLVLFVALVLVTSLGIVPHELRNAVGEFSRWCLVTAIAALGIKTSLKEVATLGWRPAALMVAETVFLAVLVLGLLFLESGLVG